MEDKRSHDDRMRERLALILAVLLLAYLVILVLAWWLGAFTGEVGDTLLVTITTVGVFLMTSLRSVVDFFYGSSSGSKSKERGANDQL